LLSSRCVSRGSACSTTSSGTRTWCVTICEHTSWGGSVIPTRSWCSTKAAFASGGRIQLASNRSIVAQLDAWNTARLACS
jgi:hypothetical protein